VGVWRVAMVRGMRMLRRVVLVFMGTRKLVHPRPGLGAATSELERKDCFF
jgi:hypothetical protein